MASVVKVRSGSPPKGRTRFRTTGVDVGLGPEDLRGMDLRRRSGGSSKGSSGSSPQISSKKKRSEIRTNQRDAKADNRNGLFQGEEDDIFDTDFVIGSQTTQGNGSVLMFGSSRPLRCLSTSCVSEKDFSDDVEKLEKKKTRKPKKKTEQKSQKPSLSDRARSSYVNRLKRLISAGNKGQKQAEMDRKGDLRQQKYKMRSTELIWLELQAWFNDRSLVEQDLILFHARQSLVEQILSFVLAFQFDTKYVDCIKEWDIRIDYTLRNIPCDCDSFIPTDDYDEGLVMSANRGYVVSDSFSNLHQERVVSPAKSNLFIMLPSDEHLLSQKNALRNVGQLLRLLCVIESLYPSSSMLADEHPLYHNSVFKSKVESLCCWYNITTDLRNKFTGLLHLLSMSSSTSDSLYEEYVPGDSNQNSEDTASNAIHDNHNDNMPKMNEINVDELIHAYTDRALKQKTVKGILDSFIQQFFASLFRAKLNLMSQSCYKPLESSSLQQSKNGCIRDEKGTESVSSMCSYRLKDTVKVVQAQKLCDLIQKMENVLSKQMCLISADQLDVVLDNSTAIGIADSKTALFDLPCLRPVYLFFPSTIFALMKQCMHLRMKQTMPFFCNKNNSGVELLTAKQLVSESKEILQCALLTRDITEFFYENVADGQHHTNMLSAYAAYDVDLQSVVGTYLDFVDTWLVRMQKDLPHVPRGFHEILEQEWEFSCQTMCHIGFDTVILSAKRFIKISADIVSSTSDFLKSAIAELVQPLSEGIASDMRGLTLLAKDVKSPTTSRSISTDEMSSISSNGLRSHHRGKAGVLWYQHQRSESPHLLRHDSCQSADSAVDSPIDYDRQISSASNSSASSFPWHSYRSTSYLGRHKRYLFEVCRAVRDLFNETRERAIKILHFGKRLRKTLEPAIGYEIVNKTQNTQGQHCCCHCQLIDALQSEGYVLIDMSDLLMKLAYKLSSGKNEFQDVETMLNISDYWMFVPDSDGIFVENIDTDAVWSVIEMTLLDHIKKTYLDEGICETEQQFNVPCVILVKKPTETFGARRQSEIAAPTRKKGRNRMRKNTSQPAFKTQSENNLFDDMKSASPQRCSTWYGRRILLSDNDRLVAAMKLIAENFAICHDITVISASADDVGIVRKEFNLLLQSISKVSLAQMPIIKGVKPVFDDLRERILDLCNSLMECTDFILNHLDSQMEKLTSQNMAAKTASIDVDTRRQIKSEINEVMQSCFNFCFDFVKEATRIMSGDFRNKITELHMAIANQWMDYVLKHRSKGKGHRPRWATQGLSFLVTIDMSYWYSISDDTFVKMRDKIDAFIHHLIGDKSDDNQADIKANDTEKCQAQSLTSLHLPEHETQYLRSLSNPSATDTTPHSTISAEDEPMSAEYYDPKDEDFSPIEEIRSAIEMLENRQDHEKRAAGIIGQVSNTKHQIPIINLGVRTVSFRWQRGARVGEGAFGQVYTCVNVDTGTVLAMKEVKFHPNDHKKITATIHEYTNFEGIQHKNLVHYYGVELHRDEMYIFMEYCDSGTLGDICKISLPEVMVRQYTAQILSAVYALHSRGIVHRDIKGSNIFLTSSGIIKLGDFGSAMKLKNIAKTTPGEMVSHIGTTLPYAAPEVVNASESIGYGRASDIWSMGCVVIEMASGKQPWQGLEMVQVMFQVGNGIAPSIPESLSEDGKDFVRMCMVPDPAKRWIAERLLGHPFVKIIDAEESL